MKILMVEDEPLAAAHLQSLVHRYESHIEILARLESVREVVAYFQQHPSPDLLLLDIHLADGLSFAIFDQVQVECPVIFTTAYDEYALRAFRSNGIDYLLKPIGYEDLAQALDRYVNWFQKGQQLPPYQVIDMEVLQQLMKPATLKEEKSPFKTRFLAKKGEQLVSVPTDDILYFYSEDKVTLFKTKDQRRFIIEPTLGEIEAQVSPQDFFRVNRGFLVRFEAIEEILAFSNRRYRLSLKHHAGEEVLVAREKVAAFKEWLDR